MTEPLQTKPANIIPIILIGCSSTSKSQVSTVSGYLREMTIRAKTAENRTPNVHMEVKIVDVIQITFTKIRMSPGNPRSIKYPLGREYIADAVCTHAFVKVVPKIIISIIVK